MKSDEAYSKLEKEFFERMKEPEDGIDLANEMCQHLSTFTGAGGAYIYELKPKCRNAKYNDKMEDSVNVEGQELRIVAADEEHIFMLENKLEQSNSLTGLFFAEEFQGYGYGFDAGDENKEGEEDAGDEDEEKKKQQKKKRYFDEKDPELNNIETEGDKELKFNSIFIPQVICDKKIHFFKVPKLGCYYAVAFELNSCLMIESLENAFSDMQEVNKRKAENEDKKLKYEESLRVFNETKATDKPEEPEYETEQLKPINKVTKKFVIVVDTLGQDRILKSEQREYIRRVLRVYKKHTEKSEEEHMAECCEILMNQTDAGLQKEFELECKAYREKVIAELSGELFYESEVKDYFYVYETLKNTLLSERYWNLFCELKNMKLIKYPQIFTCIFYIYLGLSKEDVNIKDSIYGVTNNLDWANQRKLLNASLHEAIKTWSPRGAKPDAVQSYRTLAVLEEHLNELQEDDIKRFSYVLSVYKQLIHSYIKCRKADAEFRAKSRQHKIEEIERLKEEYEHFKQKRQETLDRGEEWNEEFEKEIPSYPEEEKDEDLKEVEVENN
eukprot:Mrub_01810.p1 GENE.Mrub_01810~~Mrub_01810.p1  ORF type:complete len:626 (-),score=171.68 Mrub_01810:86-1753(-)